VARVLRTLGASYRNFAVVATREAELRNRLARAPDVVVTVPTFAEDVHDLGGLAQIGTYLLGGVDPTTR
jgi:hypothetical protein